MGGAIVPETADCSGCHATPAGGIGLASIPKMGHALEGWGKCASCHAPNRLVDTAPGHSGIHATECTICHQPGDLPTPLSRPHRENQNQACLTCHGKTAPLPSDMTHREESVCWLCHRLPTIEPPVPAHDTAPGEADCLTCHVAKGEAGALPRGSRGAAGEPVPLVPRGRPRDDPERHAPHRALAGRDELAVGREPRPGVSGSRPAAAPREARAAARR